jgi:hypothetical protein
MTAEARLREIVFRAAEDFQIIRLEMTGVAMFRRQHCVISRSASFTDTPRLLDAWAAGNLGERL